MRFTIKTWLIIAIVFLLGTNIAVIATYRVHLQSETVAEANKIAVPDSRPGRFFNNELNLSSNQQNQFRNFRQTYNRSASQVMIEMQEIRNEMVKELDQKQPDRTRLDKLADELGEKHKKLKGLTFDYYFNMQSVLNGEQQEKMVKIFQAMLTDEGNAKTTVPGSLDHRGQGQGQGQGPGRGRGWQTRTDSVQ